MKHKWSTHSIDPKSEKAGNLDLTVASGNLLKWVKIYYDGEEHDARKVYLE